MTKAVNLEKYRKLLKEQRSELRKQLGYETIEMVTGPNPDDPRGELSDYPDHPGDQASETFDMEMQLTLRQNLRDLLERVENALTKVEDGSYGICSNCKKPIPPERLEALPSALYCVPCQSSLESIGIV